MTMGADAEPLLEIDVSSLVAALAAPGAPRLVDMRTPAERALGMLPGALALPLKPGSVRFAVIGDSGRGDRWQQEVADQMVAWRAQGIEVETIVDQGDDRWTGRVGLVTRLIPRLEVDPARTLVDAEYLEVVGIRA